LKTDAADPGAVWRGDWEARVHARITEKGFASVAAFLAAHPGTSYTELARMLGADIAAVQLERMHVVAATSAAVRISAMRDSLCRYLREALRNGWGVGPSWDARVMEGLSNWIVMWGQQPWMRTIFDHLKAAAPKGWRPDTADDPIIEAAIATASRQ
jgi:hypothetical protein